MPRRRSPVVVVRLDYFDQFDDRADGGAVVPRWCCDPPSSDDLAVVIERRSLDLRPTQIHADPHVRASATATLRL